MGSCGVCARKARRANLAEESQKHAVAPNYQFAQLALLGAQRQYTAVLIFHSHPPARGFRNLRRSRRLGFADFVPGAAAPCAAQKSGYSRTPPSHAGGVCVSQRQPLRLPAPMRGLLSSAPKV